MDRLGIDAIIGDASGFPITNEFLEEMNQEWFYKKNDEKDIIYNVDNADAI